MDINIHRLVLIRRSFPNLFMNQSKTQLAPILLLLCQRQSPHNLPDSWGNINLFPHISRTIEVHICCKLPTECPIPHIQPGVSPSGKPLDDKCIIPAVIQLYCYLLGCHVRNERSAPGLRDMFPKQSGCGSFKVMNTSPAQLSNLITSCRHNMASIMRTRLIFGEGFLSSPIFSVEFALFTQSSRR